MSLSAEKLEQYLVPFGIKIQRVFLSKEMHYIQCITLKQVVGILIEVPAKFQFYYETLRCPILHLTPVGSAPNADTNASEEFMQENYNNSERFLNLPAQHREPITEHLEHAYKHTILKTEIEENEKLVQSGIHKQLQRLKYSVQGMQHRLAISKKKFLGVISETHSGVELFASDRGLEISAEKRLFVVVKFGVLWDKLSVIENEAKDIITGVYQILNNTQSSHLKNIQSLMERYKTVSVRSDGLMKLKNDYLGNIVRYSELLAEADKLETSIRLEMEKEKQVETGAFYKEMRKNHRVDKLNKKLENVLENKLAIQKTLHGIREACDHGFLETDDILFDNIVWMDRVLENFEQLAELEKKLSK